MSKLKAIQMTNSCEMSELTLERKPNSWQEMDKMLIFLFPPFPTMILKIHVAFHYRNTGLFSKGLILAFTGGFHSYPFTKGEKRPSQSLVYNSREDRGPEIHSKG